MEPQVDIGDETLRLMLPDTSCKEQSFRFEVPLLRGVEVKQSKEDMALTVHGARRLEIIDLVVYPLGQWIHLELEAHHSSGPDIEGQPSAPASVVSVKGQNLTLNFRDMDLHDALRLVGDSLSMNVVVDPSVPHEKIRALFRDAPALEVFQYFVRTAGLSYAQMGKSLIVGPPERLARNLGKLELRSYRLAYGAPEGAAELLRTTVGLTEAGAVAVDLRRRELYVKATGGQHVTVRSVLNQFDRPADQVMIKARIVEINDDATREIESALTSVYDKWWMLFNGCQASVGSVNSTALRNEKVGIASQITNLLDVKLTGLVSQGNARLLADPTVVVLDGYKASVRLIDKIKYVSRRDDAGNPTYRDEEVGPQLEVTPLVGRNGTVTVLLSLKTGEIVQWKRGGLGEEVPQVSAREVEPSVMIRDGQPFVVGGLFKETQSHRKHKIPVLGDLPLLGSLFRSTSTKNLRSQVVMIIVPHLLLADFMGELKERFLLVESEQRAF